MKIGEVEDILGITRANIRYYEKEGLLTVERKDNKYREYTEADISTLKKIIVLRKTGVSIEDIRSYFNSEKSLEAILQTSVQALRKESASVKGSLDIAKMLEAESKADFDGEYYFELISRDEKAGKSFFDICKDIGNTGKKSFDDTLKYLFGDDYKVLLKRRGVKSAVIFLLIYMSLFLLCKYGVLGPFFKETFSLPLYFMFFTAVIGIPILFVRKNYPKLADTYYKLIVALETILSLYFIYALIGALINIFIL